MKLPVEPALHLLHRAAVATFATQSTALPGYPFATFVPNVCDERHCPLLLVSALAEHTRNLLADPRVAVSVAEPDAPNVQAAERLTLVGDAERFAPGDALLSRYLRYQPEAADYLELDFMFFRVVPRRVRFIEGVGRTGWLEADAWAGLAALAPEDEAPLVEAAAARVPPGVKILGVDAYGIDFESHGRRNRAAHPAPRAEGAPLAALVEATAATIGGGAAGVFPVRPPGANP